jgi:hypothetical protein
VPRVQRDSCICENKDTRKRGRKSDPAQHETKDGRGGKYLIKLLVADETWRPTLMLGPRCRLVQVG